jgi:phosphoribosyl-ATP pyrophosphohydrolase
VRHQKETNENGLSHRSSVRRHPDAWRRSGPLSAHSQTAGWLEVAISPKLSEEATEVALEFAAGDRDGVVRESADLLYQLVLVWVAAKILPEEIGWEMDRRGKTIGLAEKLPKSA